MKNKPKFLIIEGTVFPFDVLFTMENTEETIKYIERVKKYKLSEKEKEHLERSGIGRTVQLHNNAIVLWVRKEKTSLGFDVTNLSHELNHATFMMLDKIGLSHTDETDEVYSYLQTYLMKKILDVYDK